MEIIDKICKKALEISKQKGRCIIAIDGKCGSGKSTLARALAEKLGAQIICMDDFFLPLPLRTEERLSEAGGNIHYERFIEEVVKHLGDARLSYGIFDCGVMEINAENRVENKGVIIVEGSYALHDKFNKYYDFAIFSNVGYATQIERIRRRSGEDMLQRFVNEWIPMEEKYFSAQKTAEKCDFIIKTDGK